MLSTFPTFPHDTRGDYQLHKMIEGRLHGRIYHLQQLGRTTTEPSLEAAIHSSHLDIVDYGSKMTKSADVCDEPGGMTRTLEGHISIP